MISSQVESSCDRTRYIIDHPSMLRSPEVGSTNGSVETGLTHAGSKISRRTQRIFDAMMPDVHISVPLANTKLQRMCESMSMDGKSIRSAYFGQLIAISWHKEGVRVRQNRTRGAKYEFDCSTS